MSKKKNQHVVPHNSGWAVKGEGNKKSTFNKKKKEDAINLARKLAKKNKSELIIYDKLGIIIDMDSF